MADETMNAGRAGEARMNERAYEALCLVGQHVKRQEKSGMDATTIEHLSAVLQDDVMPVQGNHLANMGAHQRSQCLRRLAQVGLVKAISPGAYRLTPEGRVLFDRLFTGQGAVNPFNVDFLGKGQNYKQIVVARLLETAEAPAMVDDLSALSRMSAHSVRAGLQNLVLAKVATVSNDGRYASTKALDPIHELFGGPIDEGPAVIPYDAPAKTSADATAEYPTVFNVMDTRWSHEAREMSEGKPAMSTVSIDAETLRLLEAQTLLSGLDNVSQYLSELALSQARRMRQAALPN